MAIENLGPGPEEERALDWLKKYGLCDDVYSTMVEDLVRFAHEESPESWVARAVDRYFATEDDEAAYEDLKDALRYYRQRRRSPQAIPQDNEAKEK